MQKVAILYDASQAVLSTFHLDEVLSSILNILRDYFQLQNAAVLLNDPKTGDLHVRSEFGRIRASSVVPKGMGITGTAVRLKRLGGQSRPKHDPVRRRVAGGDAELERIVRKARTADVRRGASVETAHGGRGSDQE